MSFVTTARLYRGNSRRLSRSTSAVLPEPTGPAMPTRNARNEFCFSIVPALKIASVCARPSLPCRPTHGRLPGAPVRRRRRPNAGGCDRAGRQVQFSPDIVVGNGNQFDLAGTDLVASEGLADN